MELKEIKLGIGAEVYVLRDTGALGYVTGTDFHDGASLIFEEYDEDGDVLSGVFTRTEACFLTPATEAQWAEKYPGEEFRVQRGGHPDAL